MSDFFCEITFFNKVMFTSGYVVKFTVDSELVNIIFTNYARFTGFVPYALLKSLKSLEYTAKPVCLKLATIKTPQLQSLPSFGRSQHI